MKKLVNEEDMDDVIYNQRKEEFDYNSTKGGKKSYGNGK